MKRFVPVAACALGLLGGLLALSASADATDPQGQNKVAVAQGSFASLDRNGDHRISRSEAGFDRSLSNTFAELDTDGDGFVSPAEFSAADKTRTTVSKLGAQ